MLSDFSSNVHSDLQRPVRYPAPGLRLLNSWRGSAAGDLAILAGRHYFLVNQQCLSGQSTVLASLVNTSLSSTTDADSDEHRLEGRPILCLGDSSDELAIFLGALYDGISYLRYEWAEFSQISILLRLSTKYCVNHLRSQLIAGLSISFPPTLARWNDRERILSGSDSNTPPYAIPHPILVLKLANEVQAPELMIPALYDLSRNIPSHIATGVRCLGDIPTLYQLSQEDLHRTLKGREATSRFLSTFILSELEDKKLHAHDDRVQERICQMSFESVTFDLLRDVNGLLCSRNSDILYAISESFAMLVAEDARGVGRYGVCARCVEEYRRAVERARNEAWSRLPEWFGIAVDNWG